MSVKKNKFDRVISIDLGNGMVKFRGVTKEGRRYINVWPSAWAYKRDIGDSLNNKQYDLDTYYIDGEEYVWGPGIADLKSSQIKKVYGHEGRYRSNAYKVMAKIVLAKMVHDLEIQPNERIYLVTGVPSNETHTERENEITQAFLGDNKGIHEVAVNDEEHIFKIGHVDVLSQPVLTVLGRYLDEEGFVADDSYESIKVGVIDIGSGTTDLDIIDKLNRLKNYHSIPKGFNDIYAHIIEDIKKVYPSHDVSDYKLLECLKTMKYQPSKRKEPVDFTAAFHRGINEVIIDIQEALLSKWKDHSDIDEILLVGSSVEHFKDKLSSFISGITIPENHDVSNVEGGFRWGMYRVGVINDGDEAL